MKKLAAKLLALLLVMPLMLAGCTGGGSDSVVGPGGGTSVTTGVAVDPYILGAIFVEMDAGGNAVQTSQPSDADGRFSFDGLVQTGNTVVMIVPGLHNGLPFKGVLKRNVDVTDQVLVVSPLTTLLAIYEEQGQTAADLIADISQDLPADSPLASLTEADLTADPMAAIAGQAPGQVKLEDAEKLAAAMAINTALTTLGEGSAGILAAADTVAETLTETLFADADNDGSVDPVQIDDDGDVTTPPVDATMEAMVAAAVAVNDYLISDFEEQVQAGTLSENPLVDLTTAATDPALANVTTSLVETAADPTNESGTVAIDGSSGTPTAAVPPGSIAEYLNAAFAAWELAETEVDPVSGGFNTALFLEAVENFQAAAALVGIDTGASQADKDKALFFGGLSGLFALANPYSDLTDNGLNNLGDLFDAFGISPEGRDDFDTIAVEQCTAVYDQYSNFLYDDCQMAPLAVDSPTSADLQQFMAEKVGAALQGVITKLGQVSSAFNYVHIDAGPMADGSGTEFDYADTKFIQGVANGMLAQMEIFQAYEHNVDIDDEQAKSDDPAYVETTEEFLAAQDVNIDGGSFGSLKDAAVSGPLLASAKSHLSAASDSLVAAIDAIKGEADAGEGQMDDLISFYSETCTPLFDGGNYIGDSCGYDAQQTALDIDETRSIFVDVKQGLSSAIIDDNGTADLSDDVTIHAYKFFDGISLRDKMPTFTGDQPDGDFPDATMGGILDPAQININEDLDADGIPDLFDGYTRFFTDLVSGQEATAHFWWMDGGADESFAFDANGRFQYSLYVYDYQGGSSNTSEAGTWEIDAAGDLVLSFDAPVESWRSAQLVDRMVIDLLESWHDGQGLQVKINFFNGVNSDPSEPQGDADWNLWSAY